MPSFLMPPETLGADVAKLVRAWCGNGAAAAPVPRLGTNSRVFRIETRSSAAGVAPGSYALKLYPRDPVDGRDRIGVEVAALKFLRRQGVDCVPTPVRADPDAHVALFEWIEGAPILDGADADVDAALTFVSQLHTLRLADEAGCLPLATEATLSAADILEQVDRRHARFSAVGADADLRRFLDHDFPSARTEAERRAEKALRKAGLDLAGSAPTEGRTLSPSDFGFHNALRRPDGTLAFLDFEYFGWDDSVRLAADFLLHPGMTLTLAQRRHFVAGAIAIFGREATFAERFAALYPLVALRWCMIVLNVFLPERWVADTAIRRMQLDKARRMLVRAERGLGAAFDE